MRSRLTAIFYGLGPGTRKFIGSLSLVSAGFAVAKVFSSIATIIMARFIGAESFGEANVVLQLGQVVTLLMLCGLHVSVMRYAAGRENPAPEVATVFWLGLSTIATVGLISWLAQEQLTALLSRWLTISLEKVRWAIILAVLLSGYGLLTSAYQALALFRQRGTIEAVLAFLLLPGLALGYWLTGKGYDSVLIAYALAYTLCLGLMVWHLRHSFRPRHLWSDQSRALIVYGLFACLSNIGYVLTFVVQPLQLEWATGNREVGIFKIYVSGSINTALLATGIFYTVFFPKVSSTTNRLVIWSLITRSWRRAAGPLFLLFCVVQTVTVWAAGSDYPLEWRQVLLFALASTLITIQATYGQILAAQGLNGIRWGMALSLLSGGVNFGLSYLLIPHFGITGAVIAIIGNYAILLLATLALRYVLVTPDDPPLGN